MYGIYHYINCINVLIYMYTCLIIPQLIQMEFIFGFRPGHSTELAALNLMNHVISEMDICNIPTNIYIDLSKAFDTLNFDILLNKLDDYGVQRCANRLIYYSYLSKR